jgi:hypothetical protein
MTMTKQPDTQGRPAKKAKSGTQGIKSLVTAASVAATLAGWAASGSGQTESAALIPPNLITASIAIPDRALDSATDLRDQTALAPLLEAQPAPTTVAVSPTAAPPQLRVVHAPPAKPQSAPVPVARSRSSR